MLPIQYIKEQGKRFFPITHRKAIVGLATNTLVLSESVDVDLDINADGEPITINPLVKTALDNLSTELNNFKTSTNASIANINTTLLVKADSDSTGIAYQAMKLKTARTITISGAVTGSGAFDGSGDLSINVGVNHTHNYAGSSSAGGSANTAVKLATARNIALSGVVTGNVNFDGSGNVTIGTAFAGNSTYLPLSGGTITGSLTVNSNISTNGRYYQSGTVGSIVAIQSSGPNGNMLWAW